MRERPPPHRAFMAHTRTSLRITTFLLWALVLFGSPARAQNVGRVAGRVLDQTGAVLSGVTIDLVVDSAELTTTTDDEGRYRFENVPAGPGELTYRLLNFGVLRRARRSDQRGPDDGGRRAGARRSMPM